MEDNEDNHRSLSGVEVPGMGELLMFTTRLLTG